MEYFENPDEPLLGPNIKMLNYAGLLLPKKLLNKMFYLLNQLFVTIFIVTQLIEIWYIRNDFNLVLTNVKISCLSTVCVIKANSFVFSQNKWKKIFHYVKEADLEERLDADPIRQKVVKAYTKYARLITYGYWVITITTVFVTILTPVATVIFTPNYVEKMRNGTLPFPHILSAWVPFDKNSSPACWCLVIWHIQLCFYGGFILSSYDPSVLVIMTFVCKKLELLQHTCSLIFYSDNGIVSDEEFLARIKQCHRTQVLLVKYARLFDSVLSPTMFFYVVICSLYLCASAIQLTLETSTAEKLMNAEYLSFGVTQLFVFCLHSNNVFHKSNEVFFGPYDSNWWSFDFRKRRVILLLSGQLRKSIIFTAGPFNNLTIYTFITILKGAYSYYTLLRE